MRLCRRQENQTATFHDGNIDELKLQKGINRLITTLTSDSINGQDERRLATCYTAE